jgi:hypothetical protein
VPSKPGLFPGGHALKRRLRLGKVIDLMRSQRLPEVLLLGFAPVLTGSAGSVLRSDQE